MAIKPKHKHSDRDRIFTPEEIVKTLVKKIPHQDGDKRAGDDGKVPPNWFIFNRLQGNNKERTEHPTQKPLYLIRTFVKVSSNEDDLVLDCFSGSGTTAVACKQLGRNFIGIEINPEYCRIANKRLAQKTLLEVEKTNPNWFA